ncbi:hypothetical protein LV89_00240 [Arcicella aurantiaca]|uniref:Carboxypeptidase-like protein n=1 Tax=Arcicella aurantiaca TaxID=591202 RepID=A0A316EFN6_9BACT|nr:carboxypeptidase-like regulatory domain-containing protein [Arcicella aurantiaca]PWK29400.1 hypothetical protein LV89_00240 [Arcicella aurantiaca]
MRKLFLFLFLLLGKPLFSQNFTFISGKIIDNNTKEPIAGVYVGIPAKGASTSSIGVVTNDAGEFILKYPILLQATGSLMITKINFKDIRKNLAEYKDKKDSLIIELQAVSKKSFETADGRKTIDYAIARLEKNYNNNPYFMYGFYQENLFWDSTHVKIAEGVLKTEKYPFPEKGNLGEVSKLLKGRSYEKNERKDEWGNLEFSNGADLVTRTIETKIPDFLEKQNLKNYKFQVESELEEYDGMPVFNIAFSPIDKKVKGGKIGKIQIDTLTMGILGYQYEFTAEGLKDIMGGSSFGGNRDAKVKSFKIAQSYHAALNNYYLHHSTFKIEAEITQNKVKFPASLHLSFTATEANTRMGITIKDTEILEDTNFPSGGKKYEESFWGNFNYVKPTEEFKKIIR